MANGAPNDSTSDSPARAGARYFFLSTPGVEMYRPAHS